MTETIHLIYFVVAIVGSIVTATAALYHKIGTVETKIANVELKVAEQTGATNTQIAEMKGSIEVLGTRIDQKNGNGTTSTSTTTTKRRSR